MSIVTKTVLKTYFETGDIPTQQEFEDLIDSLLGFLDNGVYGWQKVEVNYDDFQPSTNDQEFITAFNCPALFQVSRIIIIPTTVFSGGTIGDVEMALFHPSIASEYNETAYDLTAAISEFSGIISPATFGVQDNLVSFSSGGDIRMSLETDGGTAGINDLDQGSVNIYYRLDQLPS